MTGQAGLGAVFSLCFTSDPFCAHLSLSLSLCSFCHLLDQPPLSPSILDPAGLVPLLLPIYCSMLAVSPAAWDVSVG